MQVVELVEAQQRLIELVEGMVPGEEIVLAKDHAPVARLSREREATPPKRRFGSAKGRIVFHEGWDAPLEDFDSYRE